MPKKEFIYEIRGEVSCKIAVRADNKSDAEDIASDWMASNFYEVGMHSGIATDFQQYNYDEGDYEDVRIEEEVCVYIYDPEFQYDNDLEPEGEEEEEMPKTLERARNFCAGAASTAKPQLLEESIKEVQKFIHPSYSLMAYHQVDGKWVTYWLFGASPHYIQKWCGGICERTYDIDQIDEALFG